MFKNSVVLKRVLIFLGLWVFLGTWFAFNPLRAHGLPAPFQGRDAAHLYTHEHFDLNSDLFVRNRVRYALLGLEQPGKGAGFRFSGLFQTDPDLAEEKSINAALNAAAGTPDRAGLYLSSPHLQGAIWTALAKLFQRDIYNAFGLLKGINIALVALLCALWLTTIQRHIGRGAFISSLILLLLSTGVMLFSTNLYRAIWGMFLPFVYTWALYPQWGQAELFGKRAIFYSGLALCYTLNFLFALEFVPLLASAPATAIVFFETRNKQRIDWKQLILRMMIAGVVSVLAFGAAFIALLQRNAKILGSWNEAFHQITNRADAWSSTDIIAGGPLEVYIHAADSPLIRKALIYLEGWMRIGGVNGISIWGPIALPQALVLLIAALVFIALARTSFKASHADDVWWRTSRALALSTVFAFISMMTLYLTSFQHEVFHPRFSTLFLSYPFLFVWAVYVGHFLSGRRKARS